MFAGFNVQIEDKEKFGKYYNIGSDIYKEQIEIISAGLEKYINPDGSLNEMRIEDDWFPEVRAHVFLSHSHNDIDFVKSFAGWLNEKFGIIAFIDSSVWGNSDNLLKSIDNKFCVSSLDDNNAIKYSYKLRNKSTSNVHMILYTALMKMIDNTECLMFINTPLSLKWSDIISEKAATESPWIYGELLASKLIRNRSREVHRYLFQTRDDLKHIEESKDFDIEYVFDKKHLKDISDYNLRYFEEELRYYKSAFDALDNFYQQNGIDFEQDIISD